MKALIYCSLLLIGLQFHCCPFTEAHDIQECKTGVDVWHKIIPVNADFAFRLYREMSSKLDDKNILFSPVCISTALAMLSLGAKSETQSQIYKVLGFNLSEIEENEIHKGFCQLIHRLNLPRLKTHVKIGNALFLENSLEALPTFLRAVRNLYHAEHFSADFLNCTGAKQQINDYIKNKTSGKIVTAVKDINEHTRLVFVNYIFFEGYWIYTFHPRSTTAGDFLAYGNTNVEINIMHKIATVRFLHDEDLSCVVVEVAYSEDAIAWFILPDEGKLKDVENSLVKEDLERWRISFEYREIALLIPKFSISASYDVKDLLQRLGMTDAFNDRANLSGIAEKHNLRVSQVLHKVVLVVDEDGTTWAQYDPGSHIWYEPLFLSSYSPSPPLIIFNRPFLMVITDKTTSTILLMAKIVNPTEE